MLPLLQILMVRSIVFSLHEACFLWTLSFKVHLIYSRKPISDPLVQVPALCSFITSVTFSLHFYHSCHEIVYHGIYYLKSFSFTRNSHSWEMTVVFFCSMLFSWCLTQWLFWVINASHAMEHPPSPTPKKHNLDEIVHRRCFKFEEMKVGTRIVGSDKKGEREVSYHGRCYKTW